MGQQEHLPWRGLGRQESGSDVVEFAVLLPVLAVVLFGIIQYALLFAAYITIRNASATGARQAVISPNNNNVIMSAATAAVGPLLDTSQVQVEVTSVTINGAIGTSVTVSYPFKLIIPYVVPGRDANSNIRTITATTVIQ